MNFPLAPFIHLISILAYTYTGNVIALYPAIAHLCLIVFVHIIGIGAMMSETFRLSSEAYKTTRNRDYDMTFLLQASMLITAYHIYTIGYVFLAGMAVLHACTIIFSVIVSKIFVVE